MRRIHFSGPTGWTLALAVLVGCRRSDPPQPEAHAARLVVERGPVVRVTPCLPMPPIELVSVRREPRALVADGDHVYWVDHGHFRDDAFIRDGGLWRMPAAGGAPTQLAGDLGVVQDLALANGQAFIADAGTAGGVRVVTLATGTGRWLVRTPTDRVAVDGADVYAVTKDGAIVHIRDGTSTRLGSMHLASDLAITKHSVVVSGTSTSGEGQLAVISRANGESRLFESDQLVGSLSHDARYVAVGPDLLAWDGRRGRVRATAGEIADILVDGQGLAWIASGNRRFDIVTDRDRVIVSRPMIGHAIAATAGWLHWVESTPVADPWTKEPTPYRIGRVARDACR